MRVQSSKLGMAARCRAVGLAVLVCLASTIASAATLQERIDAALTVPEMTHGVQGVLVRSLSSGLVVYQRNPDTSLIPASNAKIFTAATALDLLGPDFTYRTDLYIDGKMGPSGVVNGSIVLKGGGDPVLDVKDLDAMAVQLKHLGVRKVTGSVIVDDSMFDSVRLGEGWAWDCLSDYYAAEISALNVHGNLVDVYVYPGRRFGRAAVRLDPVTDYVTARSMATIGPAGSKSTLLIARELCTNTITVSGAAPSDRPTDKPDAEITVRSPQLYAGHILKDRLAAHGVKVAGNVIGGRLPADAKIVCRHVSPPLSTIMNLFLKPSNNLIGEVLLKTVGSGATGRGTTAAGLDVERAFLQRAGIDISGVSLVDGSGLSRLNLATPRSSVELLTYMRSNRNGGVFVSALPIAGVDGTLKRRLKGTPAEGNLRAKTGTLRHASCLSGYVTTPAGELLVFSIMLNGHADTDAARKVQDSIAVILAGG